MKRISLLTLALIVTLMASTTSASNGFGFLCIDNNYNERVGGVSVSNDGTNLTVEYYLDVAAIADGWVITETNLHVATDPADFPQTKSGNPKIGSFDYGTEHDPGVEEYPYTMPMPGGSPLYIAAHAVVQQLDEFGNVVREETGWGWCTTPLYGGYFPGRSWATYMIYHP